MEIKENISVLVQRLIIGAAVVSFNAMQFCLEPIHYYFHNFLIPQGRTLINPQSASHNLMCVIEQFSLHFI